MSFLTTSRMDPALAARIEESVRGKGRKKLPRSIGRVVVVAVLIMAAVSFFRARARDRAELTRARTALVTAMRSRSVGDHERRIVDRVESAVMGWSRIDGDVVSVRGPALDALLRSPAIWLRGPIAQFSSPRRLAEGSQKDALLLCLFDPPATRTEKDLYERMRLAYGQELEPRTSNVRRLQEATLGLPFLAPELAKRAEASTDLTELATMKRDFDRAPIDQALAASKAEILILAADEPGDGIVELDGERPHFVRVGVVNLVTGEIVLKLRRKVDPGWISNAHRSSYAAGLDGCGLAYDVREAAK